MQRNQRCKRGKIGLFMKNLKKTQVLDFGPRWAGFFWNPAISAYNLTQIRRNSSKLDQLVQIEFSESKTIYEREISLEMKSFNTFFVFFFYLQARLSLILCSNFFQLHQKQNLKCLESVFEIVFLVLIDIFNIVDIFNIEMQILTYHFGIYSSGVLL